VGPIRQIVREADDAERRYLVITTGTIEAIGSPVQIQTD